MIFDPALLQRGARLKRSPYFAATQRAGCRGYTVYNHMLLPIRYDEFEAEYRRLLADVTLWDVSVERNVEIAGRDGYRFAELLTPRELSRCAVGEGRYVLITDEAGGIINDPVLLRIEENRFWLACADSDVLLWAKGVARGSGLQVELRELDVAPLQVQGPKSRELIRDLFGDATLSLKYYQFINTRLEGIPVIVTRTGWTGELGYELYLLDPARGVDLWNRVMEAGGRYNIAPTGPSDIRRIEAGIFNYGIDMTLDNNPYELGLERLVNLDKAADFIGREALRKIAQEGVKKKLVGLEIGGTKMDMNFTRYPIRGGGFVTSCVYSPRLKKNIGYGWLSVERAKEGARLEIDSPDAVRPAVVVPLPFIDPKKEIPKAT
jgi:glycine cleavage system aminomethyltransferase T